MKSEILGVYPWLILCGMTQVVVNQVNGSVPIEAWDILPLSLSEVATATREDKTFGRLLKAVEVGILVF